MCENSRSRFTIIVFHLSFNCNTVKCPHRVCRTQEEHEVAGVSPMVSLRVLRQAAREHIAKATLEGATVDQVLSMRMDDLRARFDDDSNAL